jgi:NNP family nitrate/nitrite transporter-like MFS transporter
VQLLAYYGLSAVFAFRGLGGYLSDAMSRRMSMQGRLWAQMISMIAQGFLTIWWSTFGTSVVMMIIFIFVQISIGTCYSIVPYVDGRNLLGQSLGVVGAGGNVGAIILARKFQRDDYNDSAEYMGWFTIVLAFLTPLIVIKGYRGLIIWEGGPSSKQTAWTVGAG